jgi:hypothetical protein
MLIVRAILFSLFSLNVDMNKTQLIKFFIGLIWFFPQTFTILSTNIFFNGGKSKIKLSESAWTELILYRNLYSNSNKLNKYFDLLGNRYFLGSIIVLLFILFIA